MACIEVKTADANPSQSLKYLDAHLKPKASFQLVRDLKSEGDYGPIRLRRAASWLKDISSELEL